MGLLNRLHKHHHPHRDAPLAPPTSSPLLTPSIECLSIAASTTSPSLPQDHAAALHALRDRVAADAAIHSPPPPPHAHDAPPAPATTTSTTNASHQSNSDLHVIPASFPPNSILRANAVAFCDDPCLIRYLVAHKWLVDPAARAIRDSLLWRHDFNPHRITPSDIASEMALCNSYVSGFDKSARPILYVKKFGAIVDIDRIIKLFIFSLETAIRIMPPGIDKITFIFDFSSFTHATSPPINVVLKSIRFVTSHYPERMGAVFFINAPWVFHLLWNVIVPFLEPATRSKIVFLKIAPGSSSTALDSVDATETAAAAAAADLKNNRKSSVSSLNPPTTTASKPATETATAPAAAPTDVATPSKPTTSSSHKPVMSSFANAFGFRRRESQSAIRTSAASKAVSPRSSIVAGTAPPAPHSSEPTSNHADVNPTGASTAASPSSPTTTTTATPSSSKDENLLLKAIDRDQLEVAYGGSYNFVYDHTQYTAAWQSIVSDTINNNNNPEPIKINTSDAASTAAGVAALSIDCPPIDGASPISVVVDIPLKNGCASAVDSGASDLSTSPSFHPSEPALSLSS